MKKFTVQNLSLWTIALVATISMLSSSAVAQEATAHQIGLIDLAHIFKNYDKFKDQTASLQKDAEAAEAKGQAMVEQMQQIQAQMQSQQLQPGSEGYNKLEGQMIELQTKLQTFKQVEQRDIVRKQAEVYKQIYVEVQDTVGQYAKHYKYTLIMRFNRQEVADAVNPDSVIQSMNRQVVWHQPQDDLTDPILKFLNEKYQRSQASTN